MRPLNFAILKYFTTVKEYGDFKALKKPAVVEAIMTGEANGLLEETRYELDSKGELKVYYRAHKEGADTINTYIK